MYTKYLDFLFESKPSSKKTFTESDPEYYNITNYKWNNGKLDCFQHVNLHGDNEYIKLELVELPFEFGKIEGDFSCSKNKLINLKGCPHTVTENFFCYSNKLTSLIGGPKYVGGNYDCDNNRLTDFEGAPEIIYGYFEYSYINIKNFGGFPKEIFGRFVFSGGPIDINIDDYPLSIIHGDLTKVIFLNLRYFLEFVRDNQDIFRPLLNDKVKFHQMVMRMMPSSIPLYRNITTPTKKSILLENI